MAKFKGTSAANTIYGTSLADYLDGGAGADTLIGGLGNDTYVVDDASDILIEKANGGIDTINSFINLNLGGYEYETAPNYFENITLLGATNINASGNNLTNTIIGNSGNNVIAGYAGNDTLRGGDGNDVLYSAGTVADPGYTDEDGPITDPIQIMRVNFAFNGDFGYGLVKDNNTLEGGNGNDSLFGGLGVNKLIGGNGDDSYVVFLNSARKFSDVITETATGGSDTLFVFDGSFDAQSNAVITLGANIEDLNANSVTSSSTLNGNGLNNHIYGGYLDDIINGGVGIDTLAGSGGDDTYLIDNSLDVIIELNDGVLQDGNDTILLSRTTGSSYLLDNNVENLTLKNTIAYTVIGNELDNALLGNAAMNTLIGEDGNDYLEGLAGNDSLVGGAGNDYLDGGLGVDKFNGGDGDDTYVFDNVGDAIQTADTGGIDTIIASTGVIAGVFNVLNLTLDSATARHLEIENVSLTGSLNISVTGNSLDNNIFGNAGKNDINGFEGNDYIDGDAGNDSLVGGSGNDTLVGGLGNDTLKDSSGSNIYVFDAALSSANVDTISFMNLNDTIWLDDAVFSKLTDPGMLSEDYFATVTGTTTTGLDADDYIVYNSDTNALYYDADGVGGAASVKFATFGSNLEFVFDQASIVVV